MSNVTHTVDSPRHPRRRRSTSLDSKVIINYREIKVPENQMKQHANSSNSLFYPDISELEKTIHQKTKIKLNVDCNSFYLFVNWYEDFKSVKPLLMNLSDPSIFKSEFPRHNDLNQKEFYKPLIFLVNNNLKVDNEYEAYLINDYDERLKELLSWSKGKNKEIFEEYSNGLDLIDKQMSDEAKPFSANEDTEKKIGDKKSNQRRFSETVAVIIQNKNQPMQTFLPREYQGVFNVIRFTSEFEIIYISQEKKIEKNYKTLPRVGVLSYFDINIYTRNNLKLKDTYILRHIYLGQCNDTQIANIDSCLRIGGPFGNDMIIRFPNPQSRNEWNKSISEHISAYQESIKLVTTTITIFNDTNPPSSVPLVCKTITISGTTVGLDLKKMAMATFEMKDIDIKDLSIIFLVKNKENVLHDEVSLMVLQDHANNILENNCVKTCLDGDKLTAIVKIIYYLRSIKPLTETLSKEVGKIKKIINPKAKDDYKCKQNKYNINSKWVDNEIPNWLMNLLADLYNEGARCEGIFRMSGIVVQSDDYINQICDNDDIKIDASIYTKASILKKFISIIDGSLLTSITKEHFIVLSSDITSVEEFLGQEEQQLKLLGFIHKIPTNNLHLFQHILVVLNHIIENSQINQMNHTSLATCFSQNLFKHLSDEAVKINKLFECILYLINRIVNTATYNSIAGSYERRKLSTASGESYPKSEVCPNVDVASNNSPPTPRTDSDSPDDSKHTLSQTQPVVPARLRKAAARYRKLCPPGEPPFNALNKRQSLNEQFMMTTDQFSTANSSGGSSISISNSNIAGSQFDSVDCRLTMSNKSGDTRYQLKTCANLIPKEHKILRSHNTFNAMSTPDNSMQQPNFQRQTQVNRKHLKVIEGAPPPQPQPQPQPRVTAAATPRNEAAQTKPVSKLTRSTDRAIPRLRSRSQSKLGNTVPPPAVSKVPRQPSTINATCQSNVESMTSSESNDSHKDRRHPSSPERKRSSSAYRVPQMKEQYESNLRPKPRPKPRPTPRGQQQQQQQLPPPLPVKKSAMMMSDHHSNSSATVQRLVKDIEENKVATAAATVAAAAVQRTRNLGRHNRPRNGPMRSLQNVHGDGQRDKLRLQSSPSYFSNKSLNERLYDSNDDDVTFI